jgi:hypothetical protein
LGKLTAYEVLSLDILSWFPSSSLGILVSKALTFSISGSWSFQDNIPKLELGSEPNQEFLYNPKPDGFCKPVRNVSVKLTAFELKAILKPWGLGFKPSPAS